MPSDASAGAIIAVVIVVFWIALFLLFRQFVLWYFRINERTELLKDIRDSLRRSAPPEVRRRPAETDDEFNSRVADALQRQLYR